MTTSLDLAVRYVIAMLLAGLWQAPLFAFVAWLVLRVDARANATTRHSILAAALLASLTLPVATATLAMHHPNAPSTGGEVQLSRGARSYIPVATPSTIPHTRVPVESSNVALPSLGRANFSLPREAAIAIVGLWLLTASLVLVRLAISLVHLERLKRDALPLAVEYRGGLTRWAAATKGARNVRLCTSEEIDIPIAVGLFDAMILVPKRLLEELEPQEIDAIVLHELAHLRRSDDWINAVERIANAVLFFNPGILWLASQLDLEREVACDDWVLQQNDALPYATCLAKVAETAIWPRRAMIAPGAFVTRRGMSIRIERLLAKHRDVRIRTSFGLTGSAVGVLAILGFMAAFVSPSIAYDVVETVRHHDVTVAARSPHVHREVRPLVMTRVAGKPVVTAAPLAARTKVLVAIAPLPPVTHVTWAPVAVAVAVPPEVASPPATSRREIVAEARDPDYIDELESVGYTNLSVDELIRLKSVGVDADYIRALEKSGVTHLSVDELVRIRGIGVDPTFIAAMRKRYGSTLGMDDIVSLRALGVSNEYIEQLAAAGLGDLSAENVRKLRALGVEPEYVRALASAGYPGLSADDIASFRAVGVTPAYIRALQSTGMAHPSISDLRSMRALQAEPSFVAAMRKRFGDSLSTGDIAGMRAVGVTPEYATALAAAGLKDLTPDRVQGLRVLGVTPDYVRGLVRAGYPNLSTDEVQQLRALGIDGEFIDRANAHGFHHPSVDELTRLKATGIL